MIGPRPTARHVASFVAILLALLGVCASAIEGQESCARGVACGSEHACVTAGQRASNPLGPATLLARAVVAEANWNATDHAAILHLLDRTAKRRGVSIESVAVRYVSGFRVRPTVRLSWVLRLEPTCLEPDGWPRSVLWSRYRERCLATFERVASFLRGELDDPCRGVALHWGAPYGRDLRRAQRAGWARVDCGETANVFWGTRSTLPASVARGAR